MKKSAFLFCCLVLIYILPAFAQSRVVTGLSNGSKFAKGKNDDAFKIDFNDERWQTVSVPHDWAIYGPFDKEIDRQVVAIEQNAEKIATEKTGRTGALPYTRESCYR